MLVAQEGWIGRVVEVEENYEICLDAGYLFSCDSVEYIFDEHTGESAEENMDIIQPGHRVVVKPQVMSCRLYLYIYNGHLLLFIA